MEKIFNYVKDLLYPKDLTCCICGDELEREDICYTCLGSIQFNIGTLCQICGRMMPRSQHYPICDICKCLERHLDSGTSVVVYDDYVKGLLYDFKYHNKRYIAEVIATLMLEQVIRLDLEWSFDFIVAVPLHKRKLSQRGYNQAQLIAGKLSVLTHLPVKNGLIRRKQTPPLKEIPLFERTSILDGAFEMTQALSGNILLIDDIITSGNTMNECARTLKNHGADRVYGLVFAASE